MHAIEPGDVVWRPGHVGLYVGDGLVVNATHAGDFVKYERVSRYVLAVRP
jgi:hypothetical protein